MPPLSLHMQVKDWVLLPSKCPSKKKEKGRQMMGYIVICNDGLPKKKEKERKKERKKV